MTRTRKVVLVIVFAIVGVVGWITYGFLRTVYYLPEAYAAWDTGTLLVEYMKQHDDHWPGSWEQLLTVLDSDAGKQTPLRGSHAGDLQYARTLREKIAVDWTFDPSRADGQKPVTRPDGGDFPVVWVEPNEMVHYYLGQRASTRPTIGR